MYQYNYIPWNTFPYNNKINIRGSNNSDDRGALLPFLAGVLVTTPFVFQNKNNNNSTYQQPYYMPYQQPYAYQPYYMPYPYV